MEQQRIKNLFTVNCGMGYRPSMPTFKKRSLLVWLMPWHWIFIPLIRMLKKRAAKAKIAKWDSAYAKLHKELHEEYSKMVTDYLFAEHRGWDEEDLKTMETWAEQVEKETHGDITKTTMLLVYKSELMYKALNKAGMSIAEVNVHAPSFVWGYDFVKGYYDVLGAKKVASIAEFRYFFFTEKQLIICNLNKNFFDSSEKNTAEDFFYKHVAGIKIVEDTIVNESTKKEFTSTYVILNSSGDKSRFPVDGKNAEAQVKCIKGVLNSKLD